MKRVQISSSQSRLTRFAPLLLYIIAILLPLFAARLIFNSAIKLETDLYRSRMQQKLRVELQRYDTSLQPKSFLSDALKKSSSEKLMREWVAGDDIVAEYHAHPVLAQLPGFFASDTSAIKSCAQLSLRLTGMQPQAIFVFAEKEEDCQWEMNVPFRPPENANELKKELVRAWQTMEKHNSFAGGHVPFPYDRFESFPLFNSEMGLLQPLKISYASIFERYSSQAMDAVYLVNLPVPAAISGKENRYIIAGFCQSSFSPEFMLAQTTRSFSNSVFKHQAILSAEKTLPAFTEENGQMELTGQLPMAFSRLFAGIKLPPGLQPAISISCRAISQEINLKSSLVDLLLKLAAILSFMLPVAIMLGRVSNTITLQKLVRACFLTGMLLPLVASIWLGICHADAKKQLETEQMLDYMQQQLALSEQKILLQQSRSILFQNIFAKRAGSLPAEKLRRLNDVTGYVSTLPKDKNFANVCRYMNRRFYSYFFVHPEIDNDLIGMAAGQGQAAESLRPAFTSPAQEVLFQLGAYNNIAGDRARNLLQRSQLTMGLIDVAIDHKMLSTIFAEERNAVFNRMSTGKEYVTCCFWKNHAYEKTGIIFMLSSREAWKDDILDLIKEEQLQTVFYKNNYELTLHVYFPNPYRQRVLDKDAHDVPARFAPDKKSLWENAQAMFLVSNTSRINHLDSDNPQLLSGQTVLDGDAYLMAHAVPIPDKELFSDETTYLLLLFLAILSSYYLAGGVAWVLLRSIPAFQASMQEMAKQNYLWSIELNSGDEFDRLAQTFNHLGRQLYERQQISQLVSRNVLDAITSGDDLMLRPGGSRVTASILFADIRSFTTLTEKYPPQDIVTMLNDYFSLMAEQIESRGGIIDKLIGDAIQAVFYHHECENAAEAAVSAGLAMREALAGFNRQRRQNGLFTIDNGVGISTGSVICGRVGSEQGKLDATIVGSLVGQAAQLESLSKSGNSSKVFIDQKTAAMLGEDIFYQPVSAADKVFEVVTPA
ncbi:MAG: hypothetical protein CVV42_08645 [Candidatus Riflebacteria bacterium HGW-Riflebacteria-2]|jgi:class 3 adenylate cyclase|nr:MAG: hypothetical protein CVV42_08645 [Candidatus Riflebacteria bacterium HGW-Riflebacteria-2]